MLAPPGLFLLKPDVLCWRDLLPCVDYRLVLDSACTLSSSLLSFFSFSLLPPMCMFLPPVLQAMCQLQYQLQYSMRRLRQAMLVNLHLMLLHRLATLFLL